MIARITLDFCHVDAIIKAEKKKMTALEAYVEDAAKIVEALFKELIMTYCKLFQAKNGNCFV